MPKGKRKGKSDHRGRNDGSVQASDDESVNDNFSVTSNGSENHSVEDGTDEMDEFAQHEAFEEKVIEALDGLTQKSAQGRMSCFEAIRKALIKKCMSDFIYERRLTISDGIERGLRKGRSDEQSVAALLAPLICVQLGVGDASQEVCRELKPILTTIMLDKSVSPSTRAKCCWALSLVTFLVGGEMGDVLAVMQHFESIFSGSYLKGDKSIPNVFVEMATLHASALNSWTLLFTLMASGDVYGMYNNGSRNITPSLGQLAEMLSSTNLEVRLAAGEALAMVFELGRECSDDFAEDFVPDLVSTLRQLATDSHKYRAKKDRKQQRATFRDILHYIEDDDVEPLQIKFGREVLLLDSWVKRKQYDAMCHILGPGLNTHLTENELLRDIFELGDKLITSEISVNKQTKLEKHLVNAAAFKARTISRAKNRDKRSDF